MLNSPGKLTNLEKFFGVRLGNRFSSKEAKRTAGDDMKIQRGDLTNVLR